MRIDAALGEWRCCQSSCRAMGVRTTPWRAVDFVVRQNFPLWRGGAFQGSSMSGRARLSDRDRKVHVRAWLDRGRPRYMTRTYQSMAELAYFDVGQLADAMWLRGALTARRLQIVWSCFGGSASGRADTGKRAARTSKKIMLYGSRAVPRSCRVPLFAAASCSAYQCRCPDMAGCAKLRSAARQAKQHLRGCTRRRQQA